MGLGLCCDVEQLVLAIMSYRPCIICRRSTNRVGGRRIRRSYPLTPAFVEEHTFILDYIEHIDNSTEIDDLDRICRPCFQRGTYWNRQRNAQQESNDSDNAEILQEDNIQENVAHDGHELVVEPNIGDHGDQANPQSGTIEIPGYVRLPNNSTMCIINSCTNQNLHRIHVAVRRNLLIKNNLYIPRGARICDVHLESDIWEQLRDIARHTFSTFNSTQTKDMLTLQKNIKTEYLNFQKINEMDGSLFYYYIGFNKTQFMEIVSACPTLRTTFPKKPLNALGILLTKLHTGESNQRLAKLFTISRPSLEKIMKGTRQCLLNDFVPLHMGLDHLRREELVSKILSIPNHLFGNPGSPIEARRAVVIADGTYFYMQKSSNYGFQRQSYSLHKYRNLLKVFLIVCPDGHIINIYGPYEATKSDAMILNEITNVRNGDNPFHYFFESDDVFILDRGFRDAIDDFRAMNYRAYMPVTKNAGTAQLTTQQANQTRRVTLCRWVVETINGRLKNQFRQLRSTIANRAASQLFDEVKIAGALLNAFGKPLTDHPLVESIISRINETSNQNYFSDYVIHRNLNQIRADFVSMTANVPGLDNFPMLDINNLIIYALGTYQISQARSYYGEHVRGDGSYHIELYREDRLDISVLEIYNINVINPWLLRSRIQSRHRRQRTYFVYLLIEGLNADLAAIKGHYCSCISGKRTLGCCSHVMSVLWFMAWARHQQNLSPPAQFLDFIIRHDVRRETSSDITSFSDKKLPVRNNYNSNQ